MYQSPNLHKNQLIYVSEDDLWLTDIDTIQPRRLTHGLGITRKPLFSPDGKHIAFSANAIGAEEIYLLNTDKKTNASQITYLGYQAKICTWLDNNTLIFSSHHESAFREHHLYSVDIHNHQITPFELSAANAVSFAPNKKDLVWQRHGYGYTSFKRYKGGLAGQLYTKIDDKVNVLFTHATNQLQPQWHKDRIYFLSDHQDHGNIYSIDPTGEDIQRHTHHEDFYVTDFHIHNKYLVYSKGGEIFLHTLHNNSTKTLPLDQHTAHNPHHQPKFASNHHRLEAACLSQGAEHITLCNRGQLFYMPTWQGGAYHLESNTQKRFRTVDYAYDQQILASCDDAKNDSLYLFAATPPHKSSVINLDFGRILNLQTSPDGKHALISNHRHELILLDIVKKTLQIIDQSPFSVINYFDWSPDNKWITYSYQNSHETSCLKLYQIQHKTSTQITQGQYHDFAPTFDPEGKYIYFLSQRHFHAEMDELLFQYGYQNTTKIYLICLQDNSPPAFLHLPSSKEAHHNKKKEPDDEKKENSVDIELIGIEQRIKSFPIPAGKYTNLYALEKKLMILAQSHDDDEEDAIHDGSLMLYHFNEQRYETLLDGITSASLSQDRKWLLYYHEHKLRVIEAGSKPDDNDKSFKKGGWIKLDRARVLMQPEQEWPFIFAEAWRLQKDFYWDKDMGGIDWDAIYKKYQPLVKKAKSRHELNAIITEMQGELSCSHAYTWGGDIPKTKHYPVGHLGCKSQFDPNTNGYVITQILQGEYGDSLRQSPLSHPEVNIKEGDIIVAINGIPTDKDTSPEKLLSHQANRHVLLSIQPKEVSSDIRHLHVKTLGNIKPLLYRAWVENNRAYVLKKSQGRFGYIHIPDMSKAGITEFYRNYQQSYDHEGIIIDVRYNGGGHTSTMILQQLAITRFGLDFTRWHGAAFSYPFSAPRGNMVAICNAQTGSDGDIFSYAFKTLKLGKLFGQRTWGGVVGINVRNSLLDGGVTTQPEYAVWFKNDGYSIENHGVDPDIEVDCTLGNIAKEDKQLDAAIEYLFNQQSSTPFALEKALDNEKKPDKKPKKLPESAN